MMRDTMTDNVAGQPTRAVHDMLIRRYSDAYEDWTRQEAVVAAMRADGGNGSGDRADRGAGHTQIGEMEAVAAAMRSHLGDLALAIERSENGTYGVCVTCGGPIAPDRLELFPAATECVTCKQRTERH